MGCSGLTPRHRLPPAEWDQGESHLIDRRDPVLPRRLESDCRGSDRAARFGDPGRRALEWLLEAILEASGGRFLGAKMGIKMVGEGS